MRNTRFRATFRYSLRLLTLLFTMTLILLAFVPMLSGGDWAWIGYILSAAFLFIFFLMSMSDAGDRGEKDISNEQNAKRRLEEGSSLTAQDEEGNFFTPSRGFIAGLFASIPTILAGICMCVLQGDAFIWATPVARILLSPYILFFEPLRSFMPELERISYLFFSLLFPVATGIGYLVLGPRRHKKLTEAIVKADKRKKKKAAKKKQKRMEERNPIN